MMPFAPARFSTTTGWPQVSVSRCATVRDVISVPPPGGYGTSRRTGRDGYGACAAAVSVAVTSAAVTSSAVTSCCSDERCGDELGPCSDDAPIFLTAKLVTTKFVTL